jgi:pimeloyl-ACP methyl ester carboxylesterase
MTPHAALPGARHKDVDVGEVRLHVVEAGPVAGAPLVVLLHGFPEFWWSWRHQIQALSAAGFRVVAPDMRGFHLSEKPRSVSAYRLERLMRDVAGLIHAHGASRAAVVGHDWGGHVAWSFAETYASMVSRLAILNVPHPRRWFDGALSNPAQLRKSWYLFFFQLPELPERWLARDDFRTVRALFEDDGLAAADAQRFADAARAGGDRLRGGVNYYRAAARQAAMGRARSWRRIEIPTLVLWGERDRFLGKELADPGLAMVPLRRLEFVPGASHWVQQDAPDCVNGRLLEFLR